MVVSMLLNETKSSSKAPECPQCHGDMTIAFLVSGKRQDFVGYTCDDCGKHISRIVPSD
jgi:transposase-like protein